MKTKLYLFGIFLAGFAIFATIYSPSPTPISPLSNIPLQTKEISSNTEYVVLGFAPYWNLKQITSEALSNITHYAYFNLHLNGDGTIYKNVNRREQDPGYTNYRRLLDGSIDYQNKVLILTFMPESQEALTTSISSPQNRQNTISTIVNSVVESRAGGVNIDYEPLGDTPSSLRDNFTLFIKELRVALDKLEGTNCLLTISVYASSGVRPRIWDLPNLANNLDYLVVMTYDYTMPGSNIAGPNSPLRGSGINFEHDIVKNIAEITKAVPSRKILLGIPFYGYEWDTVDSSKYSPTEARGSVASLERIEKLLEEQTLELIWDRNSLTPYGISTVSGQTSQIYFENEGSIRLKIEFVKSASLGGIAIWALGYEGQSSWLWPTISQLHK